MTIPLVIAHRGACGYRPEHTLEAYRLAIELGADFIEPDLVATCDGHLVARHEPEIGQTTDVAFHPEFDSRRRTRLIDGVEVTGWFTTDFTLAELKTLRAVQPRKERSPDYDGLYEIPTFDEILALARQATVQSGRPVGVYPETKHPAWHASQGLALEPRLLASLDALGWNSRTAPVFVQSFETDNLRWLHERTSLRLVQLVGEDGRGLDDLAAIARYASAIGPWKRWIIGERRLDGVAYATAPTDLVARAHAVGLAVHAWTFRDEAIHLLADYAGDPRAEYHAFAALGVDGLFSDHPDTAIAALRQRRDE